MIMQSCIFGSTNEIYSSSNRNLSFAVQPDDLLLMYLNFELSVLMLIYETITNPIFDMITQTTLLATMALFVVLGSLILPSLVAYIKKYSVVIIMNRVTHRNLKMSP